MKVTLEFLRNHHVCREEIAYCERENLIGLSPIEFLNKLIDNGELECANEIVVRILSPIAGVKYAVYAVEQVLPIFEKKYPGDDRPIKAVDAARAYIGNSSNETAARSAYSAARSAYNRIYDDDVYAYSHTTDAVFIAAYFARDAIFSTNAIYPAAYIGSAVSAANAADADTLKKIINYGIEMVKEDVLC